MKQLQSGILPFSVLGFQGKNHTVRPYHGISPGFSVVSRISEKQAARFNLSVHVWGWADDLHASMNQTLNTSASGERCWALVAEASQ